MIFSAATRMLTSASKMSGISNIVPTVTRGLASSALGTMAEAGMNAVSGLSSTFNSMAGGGLAGAAVGYVAGVATKALGGSDQTARVVGGVAGGLVGGVSGAVAGYATGGMASDKHVGLAQNFMKGLGLSQPGSVIPNAQNAVKQGLSSAMGRKPGAAPT